MTAKKATTPRDTSRALGFATQLRADLSMQLTRGQEEVFDALVQVLTDMDARTGKRDPRARTKPAGKPKPIKVRK